MTFDSIVQTAFELAGLVLAAGVFYMVGREQLLYQQQRKWRRRRPYDWGIDE